jgi:uncharacterized membrane protein
MAVSTVRSKGGMKSRFLAILSYLGILCFVPLLRNKDDEFVHFHAKQGLIIWMWSVLAIFAIYLPGIGTWFFSFSTMAVVILSVIGVISASLNRAWKLPLIYSISNRI